MSTRIKDGKMSIKREDRLLVAKRVVREDSTASSLFKKKRDIREGANLEIKRIWRLISYIVTFIRGTSRVQNCPPS